MKFKTKELDREFSQLTVENVKLTKIIYCIDFFCQAQFGKEITITHIFRTPEQHRALYSLTPNPPASSPHMRWEAVDLRSSDFTKPEIDKMLSVLNQFTVYGGQRKCAIHHAIAGNVEHFHIQSSKT